MKKIFIFLMILLTLIITGCNKNNSKNIFKDLTDKINNLDSYTLEGNLEVMNNNTNYTYKVTVDFMKKDKFKVSLINTSNNHEQVILRNDDGVFVLTPSLNKSFKFQSDWPYNNSQIYLLGSIIDDLNSDSNLETQEEDGKYIYISKVNYPNNSDLVKQRVTVNSDLLIEKVEVLNSNLEPEMIFTINSTDYAPTFDEAYFEVNSIINNNTNNNETNTSDNETNNKQTNTQEENNNTNENETKQEETEQTATIEDIIYPLYLPTGTTLQDQEKVSKTDGERVILTFGGEKSFTLVEETVSIEDELAIIPTYGEPFQINDTIGAITDNSLNWISENIEYYMVSDTMNSEELLEIASSINVESVSSFK